MADLPKIDRAHMEAWLSAPRYGKYLEAAKGNDETAFGLYLWNTGLAQVNCLPFLGHEKWEVFLCASISG